MKTKYIFPQTEVQLFESTNLMALADATNGHVDLAPARGGARVGSLGPSY